jgi:hypothetical protein
MLASQMNTSGLTRTICAAAIDQWCAVDSLLVVAAKYATGELAHMVPQDESCRL